MRERERERGRDKTSAVTHTKILDLEVIGANILIIKNKRQASYLSKNQREHPETKSKTQVSTSFVMLSLIPCI